MQDDGPGGHEPPPEDTPHDATLEPVDAIDEPPSEADGEPEDTPDDPATVGPEDPPSSMSRARLGVLAGTLVVAVVVIAVLAFRGGEEPKPAVTITTTTTAKPTTTSDWPATQARIATAKSPTILVHSEPPPEWESATPVDIWDSTPPPASQATVEPRAPLPRLDYPIQGRYADAAGWSFSNPTSFGEDDPFVMLVTEQRGDWLRVQVPVRPNGTEGYVLASDVDLSPTSYRLELHLTERLLTLYDGELQVLQTPVVIGKPETHTPTGRFYVTDKVEQTNPEGAYGPLALPISAYSEQIDEFDDGVPVIALHGTNRPELLGQDVSNGCVRMPNDMITQIGSTIPIGTPIDIWP